MCPDGLTQTNSPLNNKVMRRTLISILFLLTVVCTTTAQSHPADSLLPLSPQAASLARYGEYPVSYAPGVPEISVPIYTIRIGGYSLPISISYHASGIKVGEVASVVGLGWALNAGGAISRTVEGAPDLRAWTEEQDTYYRDYDNLDALVGSAIETGTDFELLRMMCLHPESTVYDTASDRYTYNFAGKSGVFRYSHNDSRFIPLDYEPFTIRAVRNSGNGTYDSKFYIYDTDGVNYYFEEAECSGVKSDENTTDVSAWYITKIETPYGDIDFEYEQGVDYTFFTYSQTVTKGTFWERSGSGVGVYQQEKLHALNSSTEYLCRPKLLKCIKWDDNRIVFHYADDRLDLWKTRLTKIEIFNGAGDLYKTVNFVHEYWGNSGNNYRMMLKSRSMSDEGVYAFDYVKGGYMPDYVRSRVNNNLDCKEDFWGYYNGQASGHYYWMPKELWTVTSVGDAVNDHLFTPYASDRSPVGKYAEYGTIKSITYPTGGTTQFDFELNDDGQNKKGGLRIKAVADKDASGTVLGSKTYEYKTKLGTTDDPLDLMSYKTYSKWSNNPTGLTNIGTLTTYVSRPVFPGNAGSSVVYPKVVVTDGEGGKTEYEYGFYPAPDDLKDYPYGDYNPYFTPSAINDYGGISPYPISMVRYDASGSAVVTERYEYDNVSVKDFSAGNRLMSFYYHRDVRSIDIEWPDLPYGTVNDETVLYGQITAHAAVRRLAAKETTDHATGVTTREEYTYDARHRTRNPKTVRMTNSDGRTFTTAYTYCFESDDPVCKAMTEDMIYDAVAEVTESCDGRVLSRHETEYVESGGNYYPSRELESALGATLEERVRYEEYDPNGNPRTVVSNDFDEAAIVWGYGSRLPVARVLGMSRPDLEAYSGAVSSLEAARTDAAVKSALKSLRASSGMTGNGLVSGFAHKLLYGVSSVIAANGYAADYAYGTDGKLSAVSDAGGTIQTFSYRYARPYQGTVGGSNYVQTKTYLNPSGSNAVTEYAYHDALGRPVETASSGVDASGRYVHTMQEYDLKGRVSRKWLPAVGGASGAELGRDAFAGRSSATYGDGYAYSETAYDGADRPVFTLQPGSECHSAGKGKAVEYVPNTANSVKLYHAALEGSSLVKDGYYPANTLYGELHTDEDGRTLAVYRDKRGRKVLERRDGSNDTYFVYDDLDRLRFVLSPEYQYAGYKAEYAYEYRYDGRGNLVKRILPGCDVDRYWYDGTDRLTFESVPASTGFGYRFRLYDKFGRQCVQGLCTNCERSFSGVYRAPRVARTQGGGFAGTGYALTPSGLITGAVRIESVAYYDDYSFKTGAASS